MPNVKTFRESASDSGASQLKIFENEQFGEIRVAGTSENPLFCLSDICRVLELQVGNTKQRLDERGIYSINTPTYNQFGAEVIQKLLYVNEKNLYKIIMRSDKPQAESFQDWVCGEVLPSIRKTGGYSIQRIPEEELKVRWTEANNKAAEILERVLSRTNIPEYIDIINHYIVEKVTGNSDAIPLPESKERLYSATEVGNMFGVSSNKIGRLAKEHNLKTEEYGKWFFDKSRYSNKEVESFKYNERAIGIFRELLSLQR